MRLPADYADIVADGAATLGNLAVQLRTEAERPDTPERIWVVVRNLEGLAGVLKDLDRRDWEDGHAGMLVTGQDLGTVDDLLDNGVVGNGRLVLAPSSAQATPLARLAGFLRQYLERGFEFDLPPGK